MIDSNPPSSDALESTFEALFDLTFGDFLRTTWPEKFLVCDGDAGRLRGILDLPELQTNEALFDAYQRAGNANQDTSLVDFDADGRKRSRMCDPATARVAFESAGESCSVLFSQLDRYVPGVERCKQLFEQLIGARREDCTAYSVLSRPGQGFTLHFDNQSVIVIQLRGRKRWIVDKKPAVTNPLSAHSIGVPLSAIQRRYWPDGVSNDPGYDPPNVHEYVMSPGTVAFIPRGHWHRTLALEESASLALTHAGVACLDVLLEHLRAELVRHEAWRAPLLGGYLGTPNELTDRMKRQVSALVARWAGDTGGLVTEEALVPKRTSELRVLDDMMRRMRETFDARQSIGVNVSFQFCAMGNGSGDFHAEIHDGTVNIAKGMAAQPDLTIKASTDDLIALAGDIGRGPELYMTGRLSMEPLDLQLAAQLPKLFHVFQGA